MSGGAPSSDQPASALTAAAVLVRALGLVAGTITIMVAHPSAISYVDVEHRMKPVELDAVALAG